MISRRISIAAVAIAVSIPLCLSQTPSSVWTMTASVSQLEPGAPIALDAVLRNQSACALRVVDRSPLADYRVTVTDDSGALVPYTDRAKAQIDAFENGGVFRSDMIEVDPGKDLRTTVELAELYGDLKPGSYSVEVQRVGSLEVSHAKFVRPKGLASLPVHFGVRK
jgi:hypothetical protein